MTGPEFALSVIASMIAAVLYDMLRNPSPPVFKDKPKNLLQDNRRLIQKIAYRVLPSKKEGDAQTTPGDFKKVVWNGHDHSKVASISKNLLPNGQRLLKKDAHAQPIESPPNVCQSCEYIPTCKPTRHKAFLKTAFS